MRTSTHPAPRRPEPAPLTRLTRGRPRRWLSAALAAAAAVSAACTDARPPTSPTRDAAAGDAPSAAAAASERTHPSRYTVTDLGTFGGPFSVAFDIDVVGRVRGGATVPSGYQHAFITAHGGKRDLGTLGGLNSQASGRTGTSQVTIVSETSDRDPLQENFCGFAALGGGPVTGLACVGAISENGRLKRLPTLGGTNAAALTGNVAGESVGLAEDGVPDATCIAPQKSHFEAVVWGPNGKIHKLPLLPGDEVGMALRNNDRGQVVGTSGLCANTFFGGFGLGPHAVLWEHGVPTDLGNLGDSTASVAASINNRGQVVGGSTVPGGHTHGFLWTRGTGMRDLGVLSADPADVTNLPFMINDRGQIVGESCDVTLATCRGYVWQDHRFTDLNALIPADSPLYLISPLVINDAGQIAGLAVVKSTGEAHAFLATPAPGRGVADVADAAVAGGAVSAVNASASPAPPRPPMTLPAGVRALIGRRRSAPQP
ncbi:MAG TPA: hypothetical protein VGD56_08360 [Gemmatirosa sp.]